MAAVGAHRPERIGISRGRGAPRSRSRSRNRRRSGSRSWSRSRNRRRSGSRSRRWISGCVVGEVSEGFLDEVEGGVRGGTGVTRGRHELREAVEGALGGGGVKAGCGLELEHGDRIGAARREQALGGEEDVGDGEELVRTREVRVSLHRALRQSLAADQVPRGEELPGDLQPPGRLGAAADAAATGEIHVWGGRSGGRLAGSERSRWGSAVRWLARGGEPYFLGSSGELSVAVTAVVVELGLVYCSQILSFYVLSPSHRI
jgi:hypothetical protein